MNQNLQYIFKTGFTLYIVLMLWLLFGQRIGIDYSGTYREIILSNLNLIPLQTVSSYLYLLNSASGAALRHAIVNLAGNVVMFIPLGFFLPAVSGKYHRFKRTMLLCAGLIILIEAIQLFTLLGSCDIDDFLLNMAGAAIGYWFYRLLHNVFDKTRISR